MLKPREVREEEYGDLVEDYFDDDDDRYLDVPTNEEEDVIHIWP